MGNYKFKLSDMIPSSWFTNLKTTTKKKHPKTSPPPDPPEKMQQPEVEIQRKSYHFNRPNHDTRAMASPRISLRKRRSIKRNRQSPVCSCRASVESVDYPISSSSGNESLLPQVKEPDDKLIGANLPPIITKTNKIQDTRKDFQKKPAINEAMKIQRSSAKFEYGSFSMKVVKEDIITTSSKPERKKSTVHSPGMKLRTNTPRVKFQGRKSLSSSSSSSSKKSLSESFAVIKSSKDPRKDFKESMVEMIMENNMFTSKDLEDLLACYLSLNSDEYHEVIIKVFKQIWFDIIDPRLK